MIQELPFKFEVPVTFFEKADAPAGMQRRIGGIITTESPDRQGEIVLQRGLDFNDFVNHGWFNDNHSKDTDGVLGYPEKVQFFKKGEKLPNGAHAPNDGHWAEGYLLQGHERADKIWSLGKALQRTNRRLGFSVEGGIQQRTGPLRKTIAKAKVRNVAITNCPVNTDTRLDVLAKSLMAVEHCEPELLVKALAMGVANPGGVPTGGAVLSTESLERDDDGQDRLVYDGVPRPKKKDKAKKSLTDEEAAAWVRTRYPSLAAMRVEQIVNLTKALKCSGRI